MDTSGARSAIRLWSFPMLHSSLILFKAFACSRVYASDGVHRSQALPAYVMSELRDLEAPVVGKNRDFGRMRRRGPAVTVAASRGARPPGRLSTGGLPHRGRKCPIRPEIDEL